MAYVFVGGDHFPACVPLQVLTRGRPRGPAKSFIQFLLGPEGQRLVKDCLAAGCSGYLTKPVDPGLLLDTVARALAGGVDGGGAAPAPPARPADQAPLVSTYPMEDPVFREIAAEFAETLRRELEAMRGSWEARDLGELGVRAHWLKGSGGTAGFPAFTQPAQRLEMLAKGNQYGQIEGAIADLERLAERIAVPLEQVCRGTHFDPKVLEAFLVQVEQVVKVKTEYADNE